MILQATVSFAVCDNEHKPQKSHMDSIQITNPDAQCMEYIDLHLPLKLAQIRALFCPSIFVPNGNINGWGSRCDFVMVRTPNLETIVCWKVCGIEI